VDYIKYDWCHHGLKKAENTYPSSGSDEEVLMILTINDLLIIDQDPLGVQAFSSYKDIDFEIRMKPLSNGGKAFCFFN
jgi:hypothetical protein